MDVLPLICYGAAEELELLAEYQTLRRMPRSNFVLFTVRTIISEFGALAGYPVAAQSMAAAIRRKHRGRLHNRGVGSVSSLRAILRYLDSVTQEAGLEPGLEGLVAEPWERLSPEDGTGPMRDFRGEETWHDRDRAERCVQSCACSSLCCGCDLCALKAGCWLLRREAVAAL